MGYVLLFAAFVRVSCVAATGVAGSEDTANGEVFVLPPLVVSALRIDRNPWRYAKVEGFEILTRADNLETYEVLEALQRGEALEDHVIPPQWRAAPAVPYTVIVDNADLPTVATGRTRTNPIQLDLPADALAWHEYEKSTRVTSVTFSAGDRDTFAINRNIYGHAVGGLNGTVTLEKLVRSTPPLPGWLMVGLVGRNSGVFRESFFVNTEDASDVIGPGLLWVSPSETKRLLQEIGKYGPRTTVQLLPLDELFTEAPPPPAKLALWESEAALLVHWALFGPGHAGPGYAALVALVERARSAPVTEAMFVECFGMTYRKMRAVLAAYLVQQLPAVTHVKVALRIPLTTSYFKPATSDQIGRILGDWLRMRAAFVQERDPLLSRQLLTAANRVMERAYRDDNGLPPDVNPAHAGTESRSALPSNAGPMVTLSPMVIAANRIRDPLLLAVYGLYEHQSGAIEQARELLEKAAKAHTPRPEAFRVLAGLRYDEAVAHPAGAERKLNIRQVTSVLEPLRVCLERTPGSNAYLLFIDAWEHCDTPPSRDDMAVVSEAVRRFPRNALLVFRAARLSAGAGYAADARAFLEQGLPFASDQARTAFGQLRSSLPSP